jgi:EmrB/QacA subfamily drug resistance transporter
MALAFGSRLPCDDRLGLDQPAEPCRQRDRPWVLAVAILGSSLAFIEGSVVGLALPAIQRQLDVDSAAVQWVANVYLLILGAFLLIGGAAGDRFGLRRVFVVGTATFACGALAAGLASELGWLLLFRGIQGLGAAALVPVSLALLSRHFDKDSRGRAIGTWAGASALTTAAGPVAGGWLVDSFGWEGVFLMVPPIALPVILLALWRVPNDTPRTNVPPDYAGGLLLAGAIGLLVLTLLRIPSSQAWLLLAGCVCLTFLFLQRQRRARYPMLPLWILRNRAFAGPNGVTLLLYWALSGALYFLPFNLIQVQDYSSLQAGLAVLPMTLLLGFGSTLAGDLIRRFPARHVLTVGPVVTGIGFAMFALPGTESSYVAHWLPGVLVMSLGMTISVAPLTTVVMNSVDDEQAGTASGINNTAARLAGVLAISLLTAVAVSTFATTLAHRLDHAGVPATLHEELMSQAPQLAEVSLPADAGLATPGLRSLIETSYVSAFRVVVLLCAAAAFAAAALAWLTLAPSPGSRYAKLRAEEGAPAKEMPN